MDPEHSAKLKKEAIHESRELFVIFVFLAFFFCALTTYSMLLLDQFHITYWSYGFALINALVIAKVILIGEYVHVGRRYESRPLLQSTLYKAVLFTLLVFAFHVVEEVIKHLVHGVPVVRLPQEIHIDELLGRSILVFCVFIPLFAYRELRRILGDEKFHNLVFRSAAGGRPEV
jgi:hypothetical protein